MKAEPNAREGGEGVGRKTLRVANLQTGKKKKPRGGGAFLVSGRTGREKKITAGESAAEGLGSEVSGEMLAKIQPGKGEA